MGKYSEDPKWADIEPLPTDEGGPQPLAAIAYSEEYGETMSYLRAVMAAQEYSPRVLALTEDLIDANPAHYTVWLYRVQCLFALDSNLDDEIAWLNETALANQKNYQIWHHRHMLVDRTGRHDGETAFVDRMLALDAKNYHVWSYRQWLVRRFDLWENGEREFAERMLENDVRNNSAWNHRWYVVNGREEQGVPGVTDEAIREREVEFVTAAIAKAPQNPSPWNYLRGIVRKSKMSMASLKPLAVRYADLSQPEGVRSSHALDLLADVLTEEEDSKQQAREALDLLAEKYDPIRKNYWEYRKGLLGLTGASASTAA